MSYDSKQKVPKGVWIGLAILLVFIAYAFAVAIHHALSSFPN